MSVCIACGDDFEVKKGGFKRVSLNSPIKRGETVTVREALLLTADQHIYISSPRSSNDFLCQQCASILVKAYTSLQAQEELQVCHLKSVAYVGSL